MNRPLEVGPGVFVPWQLAPAMLRALELLESEARYEGVPFGDDLAELVAVFRSSATHRLAAVGKAAAVAPISGRKSSDQPVSALPAPAGGNRPRMTAEETGWILGKTARRVRQLAQSGDLPGRRVAGVWTFDREEVDDYLAQREAA